MLEKDIRNASGMPGFMKIPLLGNLLKMKKQRPNWLSH
jgi:hypothetical protein